MADKDHLIKVTNRDKIAPTGPHEQKSFAARCHCSRIRFSVTLATAALPLRAFICHCGACRTSHGTFGSFHIILPPGVAPEWDEGSSREQLAWYKGEYGGDLSFCPTCGTHAGGYSPELDQWAVTWGIFDEKFWQLAFHTCTQSAAGGGMAPWLPEVAGAAVPHVSLGSQDFPNACEPCVGPDGRERLRAECACGGVAFSITRPSQEVIDDEYMGDYVMSSSSAENPTTRSNDENYKWKAFLDMCRDCGRLSGATVVPWILVPRIAITDPPMPPDFQGVGTLKTYQSTRGRVTRGFCGRCGATVLLGTTRRTPSERQAVLNVAMGVLRAPEGVRAEDWTVWRTGNVAWADDARGYDAEFTDALVSGIRNWGVETHGQAVDFPVI
ncbi:hypothetical protein PFICI_10390 [Pestalotiopsis fici W106-1]|uniref:CENP-V/GFA domain-containing protein n=1 Tax=Pestalotiopsis fici (strain W106-1 / CGMCC3.15140) TaxID=1229662 RepID=W3WWS1_PESFW|nr:uncharacterized protein PFICI_10390 [Pestalotiopsis fici W106-1]ETS78328.1 hypothetical protein PFICI_10390 [Pestalotiopsis fici W106-1]